MLMYARGVALAEANDRRRGKHLPMSATQVDQSPFCEEDEVLSGGHGVSIHLGFDVYDLLSVLL